MHVQWMTYCEEVILSLTPFLIWFVTAGYAVQALFYIFSSKSIGFPQARHHIGFIFSFETWQTSAKYLSAGNANHQSSQFGFQKCKQQMESMSEQLVLKWQKVYRGFSNYVKIRFSRQIDLHVV